MRHLWWGLIPFIAALVAIRAWLVELAETTGLVTLVCALAGQSRRYRPTRDQRFVCPLPFGLLLFAITIRILSWPRSITET